MSARPSRRAAARRAAIIDSDDEDEAVANTTMRKREDSDEEDFEPEPEHEPAAPVPSSSSRRQSNRRKTTNTVTAPPTPATPGTPATGRGSRARRSGRAASAAVPATPRESVGGRSSIGSLAEQDVEMEDADASAMPPPPTPTPAQPVLPSPKPSESPEVRRMKSIAAPGIASSPKMATQETGEAESSSIMNSSQTESDTTVMTVKPIKAMDTILEKPMDIVVKSRQNLMTIPVAEETGNKNRIVLTYLILTNFKSYAGKQEVGPFHTSFSSVVGPNGSGKSNVIDSLLFVFGFRASKMRQGKISALIHNSAAYPNLDHCEVAVHFQEVTDLPSGGCEVIADSQLVISRKAFKNNASKYYINGRESNFTVVTNLLRDKGVDLDHKRFLILQGEVESIAQMKPKAANEHDDGLLEYLEDIIGTSKYKTPIDEAATEVDTLNEICMEKSGRVQHVEKEKNSLEDKKNKALAYIRDENDLTLKQSCLYQLYISECVNNVAVTEEAINQIQAQLDAEVEKHQGGEQVIKQLQKTYGAASKGYDAQEKEHQSLAKEAAKFDQERVKFDERRKFLTDKQKKSEKAIANAENSAQEADDTIEQCSEEITRVTSDMTEQEERLQEEEATLATIRGSLKGKTQVFSDQIAVKQKSLEPWKDKINQKQSAIAVAESEMAILEEKANAGAVAMEDMETKMAAIAEGRKAKLTELETCRAEKAELEQEAQEVEGGLAQFAQKEHVIRSKVSNARQKADEARSSLTQNQNRGNVLTALMRMRESGRIDGFHGRLGNLGVIDPKYDVAISTACAALDNFVTDSVEAGQMCIEYLRKTNLGRGNFMCLDKLRARGMDPINTPEDAPRLFDLVQAKEDRFRPAFYHALQDTLVAIDLAQANRIAYGVKRWRVVTLAGELIDKSGTMSGGGSTVKRGLMSSKLVADTSKERVAQLEEDRDSLEAKYQKFQDQQRELEARLRELQHDMIPQLDTKIQKIELEIQSAEKNMVDAKRRVQELGREHQDGDKDDSQRVGVLKKEMAKLGAEVKKLHAETEGVEGEIKVLQDKIMEVGGEKLRAQRAKVDGIKEQISSCSEAISAAEVARAKAEKAKTKLAKDQAKASKELDTALSDLETLEEEVANQGSRSESLHGQVASAAAALAEKKDQLKELKAELDEKTAELNATRAEEIEMRNRLEENGKMLVDNQKRLRYWNDKFGKLVLQDVSDLESRPAPVRKSIVPVEQEGDSEDGEEGDSEDTVRPERTSDSEEDENEDENEDEQEEGQEGRPRKQPQELPRYTTDELADMCKETLKSEIAALETKTTSATVDLSVLSEYRRRVEEHLSRSSDLAASITARDGAKTRCDDLRRLRLEGFMHGFSAISLRLKEMYQMITMGGNAELELVDSLDPFSEGILFSVMPPKKSWKNISNLSGGEKTLSSLALVFALHHYRPTPVYVMDEIDAALDFRNVSIVANYIKERTKNAQFIVISLRNNMFELAARLVGVYKVNHMTKSVTIENRDYVHRPAPVASTSAAAGSSGGAGQGQGGLAAKGSLASMRGAGVAVGGTWG